MQRIARHGHTLTWEEHSSGSHTFIFIHGYSANRTIWGHELGRLARYGRCVSLDLPGHFPASVPSGYRTLSQEQLLDLELAAIEVITHGRPCTLIGHSTGGLVALAAAALRPALVARVVALAPVIWGPLSGALGFYQRMLRWPASYPLYWVNYKATQLSYHYIQMGIGAFYSGDRRSYAQNQRAATTVRGWWPTYRRSNIRNFAVLLQMLSRCDIRALTPQIACPVLLVCGGRDPVVPAAQSRWAAAHIPQATLLELPEAGHMVHWEAADEVDAALDGWLRVRS